jgi:hypothetical protein
MMTDPIDLASERSFRFPVADAAAVGDLARFLAAA